MKTIPALVVRQWLHEWDEAKFQPIPPRGKPEPYFYVFSISAHDLKKLTGIYRRDPTKPPAEDMGIQRRHDPDRSAEILRYLQNGFPLSRIDPKRLIDPSEILTLRMPGWIPTAIVVNILRETDRRGSKDRPVAKGDLVTIADTDNTVADRQSLQLGGTGCQFWLLRMQHGGLFRKGNRRQSPARSKYGGDRPAPQRPLHRCFAPEFLIANPRLTFCLTHSKLSPLKISNRERIAIFYLGFSSEK